MSLFKPIAFSLSTAEAELKSFKVWLSTKGFVGEREIVGEIRRREQMCCLIASSVGFNAPNMIRFELSLKGLFRTDLVLGNDHFRQFVLIEFEGAEETSVFAKSTRQYRHWSRQIEHGFGQVIDWAWLRHDHPNDTVLTSAFGGHISESSYIVVCGRAAGLLNDMERKRFEHRRSRTTIEGEPVRFVTYDDLVAAVEFSLRTAKSFAL